MNWREMDFKLTVLLILLLTLLKKKRTFLLPLVLPENKSVKEFERNWYSYIVRLSFSHWCLMYTLESIYL